MGNENTTLKTWLPQVGSIERTIILKKLKGCLEQRGMTRQEVYKGLLQLTAEPRVLLTRRSFRRYRHQRSHARTDNTERKKSSLQKKIPPYKIDIQDEEKTPETRDYSIDEIDKSNISRVPKSTTPELLDEKIGDKTPLIVKIPREAITLNLNTYGPDVNEPMVNRRKSSSTEIRIADSSVPNDENWTHCASNIRRIHERKKSEDTTARSKKPKIIEDVTCIEGTILSRTSLTNLSSSRLMTVNLTETNKKTNNNKTTTRLDETEKSTSRSTNIATGKTRRRGRKVLRLRRKFRQLFGNNLTSSELDEEDGILQRFVLKRVENHKRNSTDSGLGMIDANSDDISSKSFPDQQRISEKRESLDERVSSPCIPEVSSLGETEDKNNVTIDLARSMPLLDAPSSSNKNDETLVEILPDSSTNSEINLVTDSRIDQEYGTKGTVTILVSPLNIDSPDAFPPVSLQINMPCETPTSVPTSTTSYSPLVSSATDEKTTEPQDLTKLLDTYVFNENCDITMSGNTISITESSNQALSSEQSKPEVAGSNESTIIDYSMTSSVNPAVNITIARENEQLPVHGKSEITERASDDTEKSETTKNSINVDTNGEDNANKKSSPCLKAPLSFPKFRVLHHSELGSRWCPTPLNNDASTSLVNSSANLLQNRSTLNQTCESNSLAQLEMLSSNVRPTTNERNETLTITTTTTTTMTMSMTTTATATSHDDSLRNSNYSEQMLNHSSGFPSLTQFGSNVNTMSILSSILKLLQSLNWCIEQNKTVYGQYFFMDLQNQFVAQKQLLWQELRKFSSIIGSRDLAHIIDYILKYYQALMPPDNRYLDMDKVVNVLNFKQLPMLHYPMQHNIGSHQAYYVTSIPSHSGPPAPPPPPPPPPYPVSSYAPGHFYTPSQSVRLCNPDQQTLRNGSYQASSVTHPITTGSVFSAYQLATLKDQIATYRRLLKISSQQLAASSQPCKRQRKKRTKKSPTENAPRIENPANKENLISLPILIGQTACSNRHGSREIVNTENTSMVQQQTENIVRFDKSEYRDKPSTNDDRNVIRIADVLQELDVLPLQSSDNNSSDSNSNNIIDKVLTEAHTSNYSLTTPSESSTNQIVEIIEPISLNFVKSMSDDNVNAENDESGRTNTKNDERMKPESESVPTNHVSVIIVDDSESTNDEEIVSQKYVEPNFSILDVKSISNDVFNSMGDKGEITETSIMVPEVTEEVSDENSIIVKFESNGCWRCGEPISVVCEQCYEACYCSFECHDAHWTEHHHLTCKPVPAENSVPTT